MDLYNAIQYHKFDEAIKLVDSTTDLNVIILSETLLIACSKIYYSYETPQVNVLAKKLIDLGCDLNLSDNNRRTPLMVAIQSRNYELSKLLIDKSVTRQCDINLQDVDGRCALYYATEQNFVEVVDYLIKHNCDLHLSVSGFSPFYRAMDYQFYTCAHRILTAPLLNLNYMSGGLTIIMHGLLYLHHHISITDVLTTGNYNMELGSFSGDKILIYAITSGYNDVVKILINKGCSIDTYYNIYADKWINPLKIAIERHKIEIVGTLIDKYIENKNITFLNNINGYKLTNSQICQIRKLYEKQFMTLLVDTTHDMSISFQNNGDINIIKLFTEFIE